VQWKRSCSVLADMTKLIVAFRNFANVPKNAKKNNLSLYRVSHSLPNPAFL